MNWENGPRRRLAARILQATAAGLCRRPRWELFAVYLAVPTLLVFVYLLPGTRSWSLSLAVQSPFADGPTLWTAFASSYVHADTSHLLNNVGVYWLTMAAIHPLAVVADWRRKLAGAAAGYLLAVPILVSWVSINTLGEFSNYPSAGFSGLNSAFLGFLVVVWFVALGSESAPESESKGESESRSKTDRRIDPTWAVVPFSLALAFAFAVPRNTGFLPPDPSIAALFFLVAAGGAAGLLHLNGAPRWIGLPAEREFMFVFGMSVTIAGVLGSLVIVAPGTNLYAHLTGFVVGFGVPFLGFVLPRLSAR
ncbi:Uncharacterized protein AArcCO_1911 [Halalkaliarchaeum sp. AArc-CO]|uniref:hypothetical protein n=1 Tax=Halalkaliarchaeum sp. AArc-CO TaxID=2866381 RepID=UPI00217E26EE|nr:hypothetical protein [Halalkaliarchaeum sp. AArc-CO]UWG51209.1 Uncharacterized protein AArcCO_1911 [Halalkaliarchaeum sp. AArc-CO]